MSRKHPEVIERSIHADTADTDLVHPFLREVVTEGEVLHVQVRSAVKGHIGICPAADGRASRITVTVGVVQDDHRIPCAGVGSCEGIAFQVGRHVIVTGLITAIVVVRIGDRQEFTADLECELSREIEVFPFERSSETADEIGSRIAEFLAGSQRIVGRVNRVAFYDIPVYVPRRFLQVVDIGG